MTTSVTIYSDIHCPWAAVTVHRLRQARDKHGLDVVFDQRALAFDQVSPDSTVEASRKTRTLAGNYQILWQEPRLLVPGLNPVWFQYVSHKVGRLLVPYALGG